MEKRRKRIALIYGGQGSEREVSLSGAEFVSENIDTEKYIPLFIRIEKSGEWVISEGGSERATYPVRLGGLSGFLDGEKIIPVYAAFPLLHGVFGEDGRVQGTLDCAGIRYVGCGALAGAIAFDKIYTKIIAEAIGIPTVRWIARSDGTAPLEIEEAALAAERQIGYPMFIKPSAEGSSVGASVIYSREDFATAYANARAHGRVLIEALVQDKRELECAALITEGKILLSYPGEVVSQGFYSYDEKYSDASHTEVLARAELDKVKTELILDYSKKLCEELSLSGLSRIDFFLSGGKIYFNEINTMPGFTQSSLYPRLMGTLGIEPKELISRLIEEAGGGA